MGSSMKRKIRLLKQRYLDWKNWCKYTNETRLHRVLILLGLWDTIMFDIFRQSWKGEK